MSGSNSSRNKALIAGAVGAGVLLAGAGIFLYSHLEQKRKAESLQRHLARNNLPCLGSSSESRKASINSEDTESLYFSAESSSSSSSSDDSFYECGSDAENEDHTKRIRKRRNRRSDSKNATNEKKLFQTVDVLLKGNDVERLKAFHLLKDNLPNMRKNVEFLWRFAKAHQIQAKAHEVKNNIEEKKKHVFEGLNYAKEALELGETNPDSHKWFAILTGMQTDFVPLKEKIKNGELFHKHILLAIKKKPEDYSLYHLLGRFKFELASISWFEKKVAASLFAELPEWSYNDAIKDFLKAENLNTTPWKENRLLIAKCYIEDKQYSKAVEWLNSAKKITPKTDEDTDSDRQINLLLEKYRNLL